MSAAAAPLPATYSALYLESKVPNAAALPGVRMIERSTAGMHLLASEEVLVRVAYASINPSDVKNSLGFMTSTVWPRVLGRDFCGRVVAAGAGADAQALVGKEVFGTGGDLGFEVDGSHAQYIRLPRTGVALKPDALTSVQASSVGVNYVTAAHGLERGELTVQDIVLVTGANGGVGSAVVQIAKSTGAKVIAVLRSRGREPAPAVLSDKHPAGVADSTIYLSDLPRGFADLPAAVRALPLIQDAFRGQPDDMHHRRGPSLVFDVLGGEVLPHLLSALATRGRLVYIAMPLPHQPVPIDGLEIYRQELQLVGVNSLLLTSEECAAKLGRLARGFDSGALATRDAAAITLVKPSEIGQSYADVLEGKAKGKVVVDFRD